MSDNDQQQKYNPVKSRVHSKLYKAINDRQIDELNSRLAHASHQVEEQERDTNAAMQMDSITSLLGLPARKSGQATESIHVHNHNQRMQEQLAIQQQLLQRLQEQQLHQQQQLQASTTHPQTSPVDGGGGANNQGGANSVDHSGEGNSTYGQSRGGADPQQTNRAVQLTNSKDDVGTAVQMFSFRTTNWDRVDILDYDDNRRLHKVRNADGSTQWIDLSKKPIREFAY
eukprot:gene27463-34183_t